MLNPNSMESSGPNPNANPDPDCEALLMKNMAKGKAFSAYKAFPVNAFTHFGKPFDHFRKLKKRNFHEKYSRDDSTTRPDIMTLPKCEDEFNVANCPVYMEKQDGHHTRPQYLGYDEKASAYLGPKP